MTHSSPLDRTPKVGDPVWIFDENRRVYRKDRSAPVWREHWVKRAITGETSRSWIVGKSWDERKIPKKGDTPYDVCWSEAEIDRRAFVEEHRHRIAEAVRRTRDYDTLKKVAELIGYVVEDK